MLKVSFGEEWRREGESERVQAALTRICLICIVKVNLAKSVLGVWVIC